MVLLEARRDWLAAITLACCLLIREDSAAGVAMVGVVSDHDPATPARRAAARRDRLQLRAGDEARDHAGQFGHAGSFVQIYRGLLPKGARRLRRRARHGAGQSGVRVQDAAHRTTSSCTSLQIATPLAFLPWLRPLGWVCSLPGVLFCLLVTHALPLIEISFQYTPHWTTYLFLALIVNVEWLGAERGSGRTGRRAQARRARDVRACMLLGSHQFGAILQQNTAACRLQRLCLRHDEGASRRDYAALRALIAQVPKDARIVASETIVPHVSNRRYAYTLRIGIFDADYLLALTDGDLPEERKRLRR